MKLFKKKQKLTMEEFFMKPLDDKDFALWTITDFYHHLMTEEKIEYQDIDDMKKAIIHKNKIKQYFGKKRFDGLWRLKPSSTILDLCKVAGKFNLRPDLKIIKK